MDRTTPRSFPFLPPSRPAIVPALRGWCNGRHQRWSRRATHMNFATTRGTGKGRFLARRVLSGLSKPDRLDKMYTARKDMDAFFRGWIRLSL